MFLSSNGRTTNFRFVNFGSNPCKNTNRSDTMCYFSLLSSWSQVRFLELAQLKIYANLAQW